ncbi:acetate--CoA ligase family protein [Sphaerisporangium sp. NPDC049003]|uniref:acetate--CoA ligase family protein n=1 Tax=Sphaerisporangium sp. NPDC049003 TaxID=3364517 RepID=UPI00371A4E42
MKLTRLLAPESVAVVGASTRPGSYGNLAVANLVAAGFPGPVFGVHPTATEVHGVPCHPRIEDLPVVPDAVVIATPAATVPALVAEAGEHGCGGAVVFAAGFAEVPGGAGRSLEDALVAAAAAYDMPVCGPNGNGIVAVAGRAPLWGDAYTPRRAGPVALISQSGNIAVNALLSTRALRLHTVVSCGNQAVVDAAAHLAALAETGGVRSVALYLEDEGDGARLAGALATCADAGIGVAVLKAGTSELGASAAAAHTGAVAGDARVLRALIEEAGGAWARNPHELLELAKTLAHGSRPGRTAGTHRDRTDHAHRDRTDDRHRDRAESGSRDRAESGGHREGVLVVTCSGGDAAVGADEAARLGVPLPALSPPTRAALIPVLPPTATPGNPLDYTAVIFGDTRRTAAATRAADRVGQARRPDTAGWLAEHEAKALLRDHGIAVPSGFAVRTPEEAVEAAAALGTAVALKLSGRHLRHKTDLGALLLGISGAEAVREGATTLLTSPALGERTASGPVVLVEEMVPPGVELLVAVRRDGVVPVLVLALGGTWVEVLDNAVLLPLPATPQRVVEALGRLRGAPLLIGARGRPPVNLEAVGDLASRTGDLALTQNLTLVELNPVIVTPATATAADALIRT